MELINNKDLQSKIFTIRGIQVMLDRDLAELFNVEVKRLNEQVKRNIERFPENFRFSLIDHEKNELVAICDRFKSLKYSSNNSFAFTEQGVAMLSAVLRSETAVKVSIEIINAFVEMRKIINNHNGLLQRIEGVERKLLESDHKFEQDSRYFIKVFFRIMTWI
jgi:phage regulator Rha-like protein